MRVAGRGYRDGVRSLEVIAESLSGRSKLEIQEEGTVMELIEVISGLLHAQLASVMVTKY